MNKFAAVIDILTNAKAKVNELLVSPEDDNHRLAITHRLQMDIDKMSLLHGIAVDAQALPALGNATTVGGVPIKHLEKVSLKDTEADDHSVKTLKAHVEEMYKTFLTTPTMDLLKEGDQLVIRGVAKKAGMNKVTKDNPEKITVEFIDQIKEKIKAK